MALVLLSGCAKDFTPPKESDQVRATENRLSAVVEHGLRGSQGPGSCVVRLLGEQGQTSWVWATCQWLPGAATGGPYRIEGSTVMAPEDGSDYPGSIRRLFPPDMAEAILKHPEQLKPAEQTQVP